MSSDELSWDEDALARLERVPAGFMRDRTRQRVEAHAVTVGAGTVSLQVCEEAIAIARQAMVGMMRDGVMGHPANIPIAEAALSWTPAAETRIANVPDGFMRALTRKRVETFARNSGATQVTPELIEQKLAEWAKGSADVQADMEWTPETWKRVAKIPDAVRGMVIREVERCAQQLGAQTVTPQVLEQAQRAWAESGSFHSEATPGPYGNKSQQG